MSQDESKNLSLPQAGATDDHFARAVREKLGIELPTGKAGSAAAAPVSTALSLEERVIETIKTIYDPEIPLNIYDLGLIYRITIEPTNAVKVEMTLTAPGCPVAGDILAEVKRKVESIPDVPRAEVALVWDPPWTKDRLSEAAKLELGLL